jgi:hypothetical protein
VADHASVGFRTHHSQIRHFDAEADEEAGVAGNVNRDVVLVDVQHGDLGVCSLGAQLGSGPFADTQTSFEVVGREGHVLRFGISQRGVQSDDKDASRAGFFQGRTDRVVRRGDQDALGASSNAVFNRGDLRCSVAVFFASVGLEVQTSGGSSSLGALFHLHEEGVGVVLGDQASQIGSRSRACDQRKSRRAQKGFRVEFHGIPPKDPGDYSPFQNRVAWPPDPAMWATKPDSSLCVKINKSE